MSYSFLDSVTPEYVRSISDNGVYSRGFSYYKSGCVRRLKYDGVVLTAEVKGSESAPYSIFILANEKEIYEMDCECLYASDGEVCKHIVATLLKWIEKRKETHGQRQASLRQKTFFDTDDIFPKILPFSSYPSGPADILTDIFSTIGHFHIKVDLLNGGPQLELKLVSDQCGETVVHVSAEKSPHVFEKITRLSGNTVELSERARKVRLHKNPLVPSLHADINPEGEIELSPVLKLKGSSKRDAQSVRWEELSGSRLGEQWV